MLLSDLCIFWGVFLKILSFQILCLVFAQCAIVATKDRIRSKNVSVKEKRIVSYLIPRYLFYQAELWMPELVLYGIRLLAKQFLGTVLDIEVDQSDGKLMLISIPVADWS